jgi:hypothetical protein
MAVTVLAFLSRWAWLRESDVPSVVRTGNDFSHAHVDFFEGSRLARKRLGIETLRRVEPALEPAAFRVK